MYASIGWDNIKILRKAYLKFMRGAVAGHC